MAISWFFSHVQDCDAIPFPVLARLIYFHLHHVVLLLISWFFSHVQDCDAIPFLVLARLVYWWLDFLFPSSYNILQFYAVLSARLVSSHLHHVVFLWISCFVSHAHCAGQWHIPFPVLARLFYSPLHHVVLLSISWFPSLCRTVKQFHFLSWPDSSIPTSTTWSYLQPANFFSTCRTVTQFHFLSWPDSSIPTSTKALLEFRR